jgi:AcrR family transcriptional regulator
VAAGLDKPARARKIAPEARRQAILKAALTVFAAHGFEAARLEDVAARAGVAKGTLYLYFRDKQALFEELIRNAVSPVLEQFAKVAAAPDISPVEALEMFFAVFEKEVLGTDRKLLLRLIMAEGPRFPAIAEFYYREVVSRGLSLMRALAERAAREGQFATDAAARYPQLIVAPLLVAVLWDGLFANIDPLDVGDRIAVNCDGCAQGLVARVNFVSAQAEFTPPIIYSQEERARLVFRIEATPEQPGDMRVGQPVSIALQPSAGVSHVRR